MVLCFGDSITHGRPGVTYLRYLSKDYENFGLGSDTLLGMTKRLKKIVDKRNYRDANKVIIEIGANDVLLPFLWNYSPVWRIIVSILRIRGSIPCNNINLFKNNYEDLLRYLISRDKEILIIGIPLFETTIGKLNKKILLYNKEIKKLCRKYNLQYLDINNIQRRIKGSNQGDYFLWKTNIGVLIDAMITTYLPFSNRISKMRGLSVTVDGIHLNARTAKLVSNYIKKKI